MNDGMNGTPAAGLLATRIWQEEAEPDNPFAARSARCHGYDVYGAMLGRASWSDMLLLLFTGERPAPWQSRLLNDLAVALANPGPREPSVHAAMCGGVGGSPAAASLMAALAVAAGRVDGARDVFLAMQAWQQAAPEFSTLPQALEVVTQRDLEVWPEASHLPGFDPNTRRAPHPVVATLEHLAGLGGPALTYLRDQRHALENTSGNGLAFAGVAAAAYTDLGLTPEHGEALHLLLRLPGAAAHAIEQRAHGYKKFPFGEVSLENDPLHPETHA